MSENQEAMAEMDAAPSGPGVQLREAREARGMKVAEAAVSLHLSIATVEALEADDYAALPEGCFVRGYLRNYGRLLGLPAADLVAAYDQQVGGHYGPSSTLTPHQERDIPGEERGGSMGTVILGVVLVAAVLAGLWWYTQSAGERGTPEAQESASPIELPEGRDATVAPLPVPASGGAEVSISLPAESVAPSEPVAEPTAVPEPEPVLPPEGDDVPPPKAQKATPAAAVASEPPVTTPSEPAVAGGATAVVTLTFKQDCWTEVKDAMGKRLILGVVPAGSVRKLEGVAPFSVLFGNAAAASVEVNGAPFDFSEFSRANIARFTVGGADEGGVAQ